MRVFFFFLFFFLLPPIESSGIAYAGLYVAASLILNDDVGGAEAELAKGSSSFHKVRFGHAFFFFFFFFWMKEGFGLTFNIDMYLAGKGSRCIRQRDIGV